MRTKKVMTITITPQTYESLRKLSYTSRTSMSLLITEALELLFKTPPKEGGRTK